MTEHRKNYYEELIDKMMIDEVLNEEVHDLLQNNSNVKKKRIAILSALEDNNKQKTFLFNKIKSLINNNDVTATQHIQEVVTMLRDYVAYGDVEKKKFGEVMTPTSLVEEMLDTLPVEVWSNPDLKWLDPANGVGVFPAIVVQRLMEGLKDFEPCEEKRYAHIMENMIYVCELQPKNMFLYLCGFDPEDKYELNIYCGSFLDDGFDEHMSEVYGIEKFDIVIGNPPYQCGNASLDGNNKLYIYFVMKSINFMLSTKGMLLYVTPKIILEYLNGNKSARKIFTINKSYHIHYIAIDTPKKYFSVASSFCYFLFQLDIQENLKTNIKFLDQNNNEAITTIKLENDIVLPKNVETYNLIKKLKLIGTFHLNKCLFNFNGKNKPIRVRKRQITNDVLSIKETEKHIHPLIEKINLKNRNGLILYSKYAPIDIYTKKVWVNLRGHLYPIFDNTCIYSGGDEVGYLIVNNENEANNFIFYITKSKLFKFLVKMYNDNGFVELNVLYNYLPKIDLSISKINDSILYQELKLTNEEIKIIEENTK